MPGQYSNFIVGVKALRGGQLYETTELISSGGLMGKISRKQYFYIKNSLTSKEKELIDFYEVQWHLKARVPTIDEVAAKIGQGITAVNYYLQRKPVIDALEKRGIKFQQHTQTELTSTQIAAATVMMNFADDRPAKEKLDELGILPATYYAWLNDPVFKNFVELQSQRTLGNIKPTAIAEYSKKIQQGDTRVLLHYMDNTGTITSDEAPESETLIKMLIEIIQEHVKDPEVIMNIATAIKNATLNRTLDVVEGAVVAGEVVSNEEVVQAQKMLGV